MFGRALTAGQFFMEWYLLVFSDHKRSAEYATGIMVSTAADLVLAAFSSARRSQGLATKLAHTVCPTCPILIFPNSRFGRSRSVSVGIQSLGGRSHTPPFRSGWHPVKSYTRRAR